MQKKYKVGAMKFASIAELQPFFCKDTHYIPYNVSLHLNLTIF